MKKFQFTLQKLMDFRQQELDRQKNTLSALQADLQRIYAEKEQLIKQVEVFSTELETVCRQGAQAFEISVRKRYIVTLQQEIHAKDASAVRKQEEIIKQAADYAKQIAAEANKQAADIVEQAKAKDKAIREALSENLNKSLSEAAEVLTKSLKDVNTTRDAVSKIGAAEK